MARKSNMKKVKEGVYTLPVIDRRTGKPDVAFYVSYYTGGKRHMESVGREARDGMSVRKAARIRTAKEEGRVLPIREQRANEARAKAEEDARWTMNKLFAEWSKDPDTSKRGLVKTEYKYKKHIQDLYGAREPKDFTITDIDQLRTRMAKTYAAATVKGVISLLSRLARYGATKGHCPGFGFIIDLKNKRPEQIGRQARMKKAPTDDMIVRWVDVCRNWPDKQMGNFLLLMYYTGMRRGSAWNLRWDDVRLDEGKITLFGTKSGRDIHLTLTADAVALLREHPKFDDVQYVFVGLGEDGRLSLHQVTRTPRKIRDAAGIPKGYDPCHMLRVNLATQLAAKGVPTYYIQQAGGWETATMVDHYTKVRPEVLQSAVDVMSHVLKEAESKSERKDDIA